MLSYGCNAEEVPLLLPLHQLLHLVVPDGALGGDDHGSGSLTEGGDGAADDGGAVGGRFAPKDDARGFDGGDDLDLDGRGGDGVLGEAFLRGDAELDGGAGVELDAV